MQTITPHYLPFQQPAGRLGQIADCLMPGKTREINEWALAQLDIRPYQQILEVGYGNGSALRETARKLKVGFLAGIDRSIGMYQMAYRRNKQYISRQLLQLHLGEIKELPYPSHYFHTIYGINAHLHPKDPQEELLRLAALLKNGGRLMLVFQFRRSFPKPSVRLAAEKLERDYRQAGLVNITTEVREQYPSTRIVATGFKI